MRYLHFGIPRREEEYILAIAPKDKYLSLNEFVMSALVFLAEKEDDEYDANYWLGHYQRYKLINVEKYETRWELTGYDYSVNEENKLIQVIIEPILRAYHIGPRLWNDITWCLETEEDYIFYNWNTTA